MTYAQILGTSTLTPPVPTCSCSAGFGVKAQQQALIIQPVFVGAYSIAIVHWQPGKAAGSHGTAAAASGGMGAENRTLRRATFAFDVPEYGAAEDSETCVFV